MPHSPLLTRQRIWTAYAVAIAVDAVQFALGPIGWAFADEILDVAAMLVTWRLIGFHPLLLPTFVLEVVPVADLVPAWTCAWRLSSRFAASSRTRGPRLPCLAPLSTCERQNRLRGPAARAAAAETLATSRRPFLICAARAGSVSIDTASAATASGVNSS